MSGPPSAAAAHGSSQDGSFRSAAWRAAVPPIRMDEALGAASSRSTRGWKQARKHVASGKVSRTPGARLLGVLRLFRSRRAGQWKLISTKLMRGDSPALGLRLDEFNIVTAIDGDSPAARSGKLLVGDVIVAADGINLGRSTLGAVLAPLPVHSISAYRWTGEPGTQMIDAAPDAVRLAMAGGKQRTARVALCLLYTSPSPRD